ncbi:MULTISPECIES: DMT family transporter [Marinobacter]|uniref:DMT family transporter n=3 Tax=Marinobacter TaxID=2742 RepID=A0A3D8H3H1_9GAMM|nr:MULTISPECIES: DMT family transporter [Marinobacter]HBC34885.1 EamA/RhaT family transporter [Marinobacter adhaerens]MAK51757.1 EamA/RhaT family transporter [Marinobacter sp.]MAK52129.1 EamA/RhaT family transporter [Marinobacter sp.]MCW9008704.1 DMT family transporter [Marinobacter sp.]PPI81090.1 EamA/RhaT family transporter [Marinobacter flavimaris]
MTSVSRSGVFLLSAAFSAVFMGTIGAISVYAGVGAETVTFYRLFIGAVLVAVYLLATRQHSKIFMWPGMKVLVTGAFLAGFVMFYILAMDYTSMANAVLVLYLAPVTASVAAHFFLGERLTSASVGLVGFALLGFAMMMEFNFNLSGRAEEAIGLAYAFCAMLCYSAFMLTNRSMDDRVHVFSRSGYQMLAGALCMLPLVLLESEVISGAQWGWLIAAGILPGFLAILLAVIALRSLPAATFGTLAYLEPITVVALAWILFDQGLNSLQLAGCALIILAGIAQALLLNRRSEAEEIPGVLADLDSTVSGES